MKSSQDLPLTARFLPRLIAKAGVYYQSRTMNTQKTPLVQKAILGMLVLIFGCLVLLLMNGRKQIEVLREGNGPVVAEVGDSNSAPSIHKAFPSMRSSKIPAPTKPALEPAKVAATQPAPAPTRAEAAAVEQPPIVLPAANVIEPPEAVSAVSGVSGRVVLVGVPPQEKIIHFDQTCGSMHETLVTTRHYVVSPDGGLANVFVYISRGSGVDGKRFPTPTTPVLLDQKDCMYQPYVIGAMVNQPIQIKNSDPILHNVHALPKNDRNLEFNFAQPVQDQTDERAFARPEEFVKFKCEVHDWMFAYVCVASNPYFAISDTNGMFQLPPGLPPGGYTITASHLKAGTAKQNFVLKKDAAVRLEFRLQANRRTGMAQR